MTSDQVETINKPRGVLETEASVLYFTEQPLIGASPRCLLLGVKMSKRKTKARLFLPISHTSGAIWSVSSYLMPSSTLPDLDGSQIGTIPPPGYPLPHHLL